MENITILNLIEKLKNIDEGDYEYKSNKIKIKKDTEEHIINIIKNNIKIEIDINKKTFVTKNNDIDLYVYNKIENDEINIVGKYVENDKHYFIYKDGIEEKCKEKIELNSNNLLKKIHDLLYIGKDITTDKNYIFYKKNNDDKKDFNENYLKIPVTDKALNSISKFGNLSGINKFKMNLIKEFIGEELLELLTSLDLSKIVNKINNEFDEINRISIIYKNMRKYLILDETISNDLNEFIELMLSNPLEQKTYYLKNNLNNLDLKDTKNLKSLKKDINDIIKLQRKENIKKLINKK